MWFLCVFSRFQNFISSLHNPTDDSLLMSQIGPIQTSSSEYVEYNENHVEKEYVEKY